MEMLPHITEMYITDLDSMTANGLIDGSLIGSGSY